MDVDALHSAANLNPAHLTIRGDVRFNSAKLRYRMEGTTATIFFIFSGALLSYSSAQIKHHPNSNLPIQRCSPWNYYEEDRQKCQCFSHVICSDNEAYLKTGYCATFDDHTGVFFLALCPYFQSDGFNLTKFDKHLWYIPLPENASELNDYLCGTMDRRGRVCSKCKDGFGPAVMPVGFQIQCSKCIGVWYGIPLYLFLELFPITIFYFILLIFQINITSAPMTGYIMYSQIIVMAWDRIFSGDMPDLTGTLLSMSKHYKLYVNILLTIYDIWNIRFFRYLIPPFCISSKLKPMHIAFLSYASVFYPLCLIFLTWACVKLHDRDFRPIVWLWKPFHRCIVCLRRGWNTQSDIIGVFASFFLLSFTKCLYQVILLMTSQRVRYEDLHGVQYIPTNAISLDLSMIFGSTEHLVFAIPALILSCIFNIVPTLLLLLYPFRLFRACLTKCKLNGLALYTFVEKFYGCYRNGLDGGKDMRSFAGLYFVLRMILIVTKPLGDLLMISNFDPFYSRNIIFTVALVLISVCRPYKQMYMNILDTLLLAHLGLLCHLISSYPGFEIQANFVYTTSAILLMPFAVFVVLISANSLQQIMKTHAFKAFIKRIQAVFSCSNPVRALIEPTTTGNSYGTIQ